MIDVTKKTSGVTENMSQGQNTDTLSALQVMTP